MVKKGEVLCFFFFSHSYTLGSLFTLLHIFLLDHFRFYVLGNEGVALFEGGTWSSGLRPLLQLYHVTFRR